mmetsp:Transcript_17314/g.49578  ORF Transcript_17314/g.49578 Transcript_17314/m.49578 type:complete len:324 (-) Transcript_17314:354-1325(-)|eukprot:CAMPEP_0181041618 /NCGR_PEP_ID=MMETSP1070-20121207/11694_1 /TAXON_ID=265543 /ORGANISM="Minutocellus polymorphus, Strain NH13" /LENGTH=323 /DNA_ID=CAMNT_0023119739 /DNA_START=174 /DNA_END=1145 /DNA_ORIENTATION=+
MRISSSVVLLACFAASTVAVAVADGRTLRGRRRLKKKTSQSSDVGQAGRNVNNLKKVKQKKGKKGPKVTKDTGKAMAAVSSAFSHFTTQLKEYEGMNVLGKERPLQTMPETTPELSKEEGPDTPATWTPPSSVKQEEEDPGGAPGNVMPPPPNDIDFPDIGIPDNETEGGGGVPDKEIEGGEAGKPETESETMPETETGGGADITTPQVEKNPEEASPPQLETTPPAKTSTAGTGGASTGNSLVTRPVVVPVGNCNLNVASLVAKEDPKTTTKKCLSSCECAQSCCIPWVFGPFCAEPHSSREGRAAFGGGYVRCMPQVEPSQ